MQYADGGVRRDGRGVAGGVDAQAACFHAHKTGLRFGDIGVEQPDGVGAAAHAGYGNVGLPPDGFLHLRLGFAPNHALEIAHHFGVGRGASGGADDVKGVVHAGNPFAHGFVHCVFKRAAAAFYADDVGA